MSLRIIAELWKNVPVLLKSFSNFQWWWKKLFANFACGTNGEVFLYEPEQGCFVARCTQNICERTFSDYVDFVQILMYFKFAEKNRLTTYFTSITFLEVELRVNW